MRARVPSEFDLFDLYDLAGIMADHEVIRFSVGGPWDRERKRRLHSAGNAVVVIAFCALLWHGISWGRWLLT